MQAVERNQIRAAIPVSPHIKERVVKRKQNGQTYSDVLEILLDTIDTSETATEQGVVFLHTVYINGELKKLQKPLLLKMSIQEDNTHLLANEEYAFHTICPSIAEGLEDIRHMFDEDYCLYTRPENQRHPLAVKRGKLLMNAVRQ